MPCLLHSNWWGVGGWIEFWVIKFWSDVTPYIAQTRRLTTKILSPECCKEFCIETDLHSDDR